MTSDTQARRSSTLISTPVVGPQSRKGSFASIISRGPLDKESLAHVLDEIHTNASRSETLTSFSDFDTNVSTRVSGAKDLVSGGISSLYTRLRHSVIAASSPIAASPRRPSPDASSLAESLANSALVSLAPATSSPHSDFVRVAVPVSETTKYARRESLPNSPVSSRHRDADSLHDPVPAESAATDVQSPRSSKAATILTELTDTRSSTVTNSQIATPAVESRYINRRPSIEDYSAIVDDDNDDSDDDYDDLSSGQHRLLAAGSSFAKDPPAVAQFVKDVDKVSHQSHPVPPPLSLPQVGTSKLLPRISEKAPPTVNLSRTSSAVDGAALLLENVSRTSPASKPAAAPKRLAQKAASHAKSHAVVPAHIKRRVVSKEFWMKDENAKDCFYCGHAFSAFRRKHHCRTCGQIFDSQCTVLVSGRPFDLPGSLRICHPCEAVIYASDDDSTDFSDNSEEPRRNIVTERQRTPKLQTRDLAGGALPFRPEDAALATPSIGIPASRRTREGHGGSAVIEFAAHHPLGRAQSSRSLRSNNARTSFPTHRRQNSRFSRTSRHSVEDHVPFHQDTLDPPDSRALFPAYNTDTIIDPDLAPFMSDDGSDDEPASMFSVLNTTSHPSSFVDNDRAGPYGPPQHGGSRKGPPRPPSRTNSKLRRRNTSIASMNFPRPSPRRSRSQNLSFRDPDIDRSDRALASPLPSVNLTHKMLESSIIRSAALQHASPPRIELNAASLQHVRGLLAQLLEDNKLPSLRSWEKALVPILLRCTDEVDPNVQHGDDMDVRNYVKLKKIPGGRPADTTYVSGVVFSKNVALKSMKRNLVNPSILVVTFAIEYARHHQHFISLEPVIAQEREYLRNLVGRVAALKPDVLLVHRNVSGLALGMLQDAGITVVYNVKESVLAAVARVTQTVMIRSVDKLSMDSSQLGLCGSFDVKTYVNAGMRKSYIYLAGCNPSLGCTIVLRGATTEILQLMKRITEFMCYVVYNLRLETCLLRDESILIPTPDTNDAIQQQAAEPPVTTGAEHASDADGTLQVTPVNVEENMPRPIADGSHASMYRDLVERSRTRLLSSSPFVKFIEPYLLIQAQEQERRVEEYKGLRDRYIGDPEVPGSPDVDNFMFELIEPEMITQDRSHHPSEAMRRFLYDVHNVQYQRALKEYNAKKKQWISFYEGSNSDPFDPFTHQNIFVLQSLVSTLTSAPCAGPEVIGLSFYAAYEQSELNYEDDCTLGQYVEDICLGANTPCKTCNRRMFDHHRQYVHGPGQLSVSVTSYPPRIKGLADSILMWSTCKICKAETSVIPMSDSTWRYSFGKYLELSFWSTPLKPRADLCSHDLHKDFVRCFGFQEQCVRVQYDKIEIYEVIVPTGIINWAVSSDLKLKNQLYRDCADKVTAFFDSVRSRLESINISSVTPEKASDAQSTLTDLHTRADTDYQVLEHRLQGLYMSSRFYEVVPLNQTIRLLEEKALTWDEEFADFERNYFPSENDIRRLATLQLKKLFLDREEKTTPDTVELGDAVEMKERPTHDTYLTDEELHSEKAQHMLNAVVEEHSQLSEGSSGPPSSTGKVVHLELPVSHIAPRQLSPQEKEDAVNDSSVTHLDLATTIPHIELPSPDDENAIASPIIDGRNDIEVIVEDPVPLNQALVERIEQIQVAANKDKEGLEMDESKIPRPTALEKPRNLGLSIAPVLNRTQSQPDRVVPVLIRTGPDSAVSDRTLSSEGSDSESAPSRGNILGEISRIVEQKLLEKLGAAPTKPTKASQIPRSVPQKTVAATSSRVTALAKHFEELSRDFERERLRERRMRASRSRRHRAINIMSSQPVVEVYRDASEAFAIRPGEERTSKPPNIRRRSHSMTIANIDRRDYARKQINDFYERHDTTGEDTTDNDIFDSDADPTMSEPDSTIESGVQTPDGISALAEAETSTQNSSMTDKLPLPAISTLTSPISVPDGDLALPKHEKSSLMKMLSSFWSERSASGWAPLDYPLHHTEHVLDDSNIIVREDEPSSVIALALSSKDYIQKLNDFRRVPRDIDQPEVDPGSPEDYELQQAAIEAALVSETGTHMKYSFGHNQVKAQCKIFYAESFDALRRKCGVSERFVESLSRSIKWDSKGGKTRSLFLKTLDDRFVIKSLQEVELKAFTRCAPDYFAFMAHSLFHGVPSVIAKMFGVFQVLMKNPATGVEFNSYLLVMENLFYDSKPTRRFDLKGSMRNRKIESTGQPDEVLLDENLVETIFETPLFVREHARKLVKASVWNDTMWLCKQNVMDYSLMAGFDDAARTLTVGIIDCIRTYTWDKKLESWIKDRGKNKPTITSPKDYRNRFRVSMLQYVLQAPNVYHEFSKHVLPPMSLRNLEHERARQGAQRLAPGAASAVEAAGPVEAVAVARAEQNEGHAMMLEEDDDAERDIGDLTPSLHQPMGRIDES